MEGRGWERGREERVEGRGWERGKEGEREGGEISVVSNNVI